ncbi:MAG TPA: hypothetical protein VHZ24_14790, partial [Pirellulales bacterium]|nr:hypothetical protein [Pirellulales bacterium]
MLIIISDLHWTDQPGAAAASNETVEQLARQLRRMVEGASWRLGGRYLPLVRVDLLLLGDCLDMIHSPRWSAHSSSAFSSLRPWDPPEQPGFAERVMQITSDILHSHQAGCALLRGLAAGGLTVPPSETPGRPALDAAPIAIPLNIHYMIGDHDWPLRLPGKAFDAVRQMVVRDLGLSNDPTMPFPHDPADDGKLLELLRRHRVMARHGDIFDPLAFGGTRAGSSLADVLIVELFDRFAAQLAAELAGEMPPALATGLADMQHVRPMLAARNWLDGLLTRSCPSPAVRHRVTSIWDQLVEQMVDLPIIRRSNEWHPSDLVDGLRRLLTFRKLLSTGGRTGLASLPINHDAMIDAYRSHALAEADYRNRRAKHIVYGHTHVAETIALDASHADGHVLNQVYLNAGCWQRVVRPARHGHSPHDFIPYDSMTILAFYQADE